MPVPGYKSAWTKDGSTIASCYYISEFDSAVDVTISSVPHGEIQQVLQESANTVSHLAWHDDGDRLAGLGNGVKVWRVSTGATLGVTYVHSGLDWPMAYSQDGNLLAVTNGRTVQVRDTQTGELVARLAEAPAIH